MATSVKNRQAAVALYRTLLKLTRDLQGVLGSSTAPLPSQFAGRRNPWAANDGLKTVQDFQKQIQTSFRKSVPEGSSFQSQIMTAIQGVSSLDNVVQHAKEEKEKGQQTKSQESAEGEMNIQDIMDAMKQVDKWALETIESSVEWLPHVNEMIDQKTTDETVSEGSSKFPLFPLSGPFFRPGQALPIFSSDSYYEQPVPGDAEVQLQIFEPRYRKMYGELLLQKNRQEGTGIPSGFVVPFAHPTEIGRYAAYGMLYEITNVREVADETQGQIQYVCQHTIHPQPVKISNILNPQVFSTRETYMEVEGQHLLPSKELQDEFVNYKYTKLMDQLRPMAQSGHGFADKAMHGLVVKGAWGFLKVWNSALQERLLQTELKLASQIKLLQKQKFDQADGPLDPSETEKLVLNVQQNHRQEVLSLQLEGTLITPRLLQCRTPEQCEAVLLELVETEQKRKPFPRRL